MTSEYKKMTFNFTFPKGGNAQTESTVHSDKGSIELEKNAALGVLERPASHVGSTDSAEYEDNLFDYDTDGIVTKNYYFFNWFNKVAANLNAEVAGIERIPVSQQTDTASWHSATMWFSTNMVLPAYSGGVLGPLAFNCNFGTCVLVIFFFNNLGALPVAYCSLFGTEFGLRQMILSRIVLGNITGRFFSLINVVACCGYTALNTLVSAELLNEVNKASGHNLPLWGGCLVVIGATILISTFGYKTIHAFEKYSWIPNFAVFLVMIARLKISGNFSNGPWGGGSTTAGGVLSFAAIVFGSAAAWTTYAADYTVYMPRDTVKWKLFLYVMIGLCTPLMFTQILGAAVARGAMNNKLWMEYYNNNSAGGLTYAVLVPESLHKFGDFCSVLLAMSTVAINTPSMYTMSLSVQAIWEPFAKIPRVLLTLLGCGATLAICIPAAYFFQEFLGNFLSSVSYYAGIYISIFFTEHFFFRRGFQNYNISSDWNTWEKLPIGIASALALIAGAFGVALGMSQTYWTGQIARRIGKDGADIGFEMALGWTFVIYVISRPVELKYIGR